MKQEEIIWTKKKHILDKREYYLIGQLQSIIKATWMIEIWLEDLTVVVYDTMWNFKK